MKLNLIKPTASLLALSLVLAACQRGGNRGLNAEEQAKLDGIAAREAEVNKKEQEIAAQMAKLSEDTKSLTDAQEALQKSKEEFNAQAAQLEISRQEAEQKMQALEAERIRLSKQATLNNSERQRLSEVSAQQADLRQKLDAQTADLAGRAASIEVQEREIAEKQRKLAEEREAAIKLIEGENAFSKLMSELVAGQPTQILVTLIGLGSCEASKLASLKAAVAKLPMNAQNPNISKEDYNKKPCHARYIVTTDSAQKVREVREQAYQAGMLPGFFKVSHIRVRTTVTSVDTKGNRGDEIQIFDSKEVDLKAPISQALLVNPASVAGYPSECRVIDPACLAKLNLPAPVKSKLSKAVNDSIFVTVRGDDTGFLANAILAKWEIKHEVYAVGPRKEETSMIAFADLFSTKMEGEWTYLSLPGPATPTISDLGIEGKQDNDQARVAYMQRLVNLKAALQ